MKKIIKNLYNIIRNLLENIRLDHISEYSAQCAYYTILSFIPFLILLMTMVQYTGIEQQTIIDTITKIVPSNMNDIVLDIVREIYSKSIGTISLSIIFTLWSAGRSLYALTKGFQSIYKVTGKIKTNYFYLRFKAIIQTMIFITVISIALALSIFRNGLILLIQTNFETTSNLGTIYTLLTKLGFIFLTFIMFLLLYKFMLGNKSKIRHQVLGATFGAVALNVISFVFSIYLDIFKGFSITYGSLTALILIMMWTYACFYIIFLGAEINKYTFIRWGVKYK